MSFPRFLQEGRGGCNEFLGFNGAHIGSSRTPCKGSKSFAPEGLWEIVGRFTKAQETASICDAVNTRPGLKKLLLNPMPLIPITYSLFVITPNE